MMKWLPKKLCGWAVKATGDLSRLYLRSTPEKQAGHCQRRCIKIIFNCLTNQTFMGKAIICLLEGKRGVGRKSRKPVILWIKERNISVQVIGKSKSVGSS